MADSNNLTNHQKMSLNVSRNSSTRQTLVSHHSTYRTKSPNVKHIQRATKATNSAMYCVVVADKNRMSVQCLNPPCESLVARSTNKPKYLGTYVHELPNCTEICEKL